MHRRRRTAVTVSAVALIAGAPLLTACGGDAHPGAAAVVGGQRITVAQLESRVDEVRTAQRNVTANQEQYDQVVAKSGGLTRSTLHTMVLDQVLDRAAKDAGVSVSRKEIQAVRGNLEKQAGGLKALQTAWLQQYNVPPSRLDDNLRTEVEAQKLAQALGIDMNTTEGQAVFWNALSKASKQLSIDLNPRYGAWDVKKSGRVDTKTPWLHEVTASQPTQA
ncbi:SurA N-terminal domain-containing protein [Streptomyces sp. NPDC058001]|uniref:SurA N-terminal domain-containing protein n=1 Tax=Streptomyces sp. NPDC058001 TaxID=3346300 RepID=UPI0036E01388